MKTYIMHYPKLIDRKTHILKELQNQDICNYEFIEKYNQEDLDDQTILNYYRDDEFFAKTYAEVTIKKNVSIYEHKKLQPTSISLCIKHVHALELFLKTDSEYALFIEDDCTFLTKVNLDKIINDAPKNWDIIFIGGPFNHSIANVKIIKNEKFLLSEHPSTNTTSSLIYNKKSAKITLDSILPFYLPIDWQLNHVFYKNNFNVYHLFPYICNQSSGVNFLSTVTRQ